MTREELIEFGEIWLRMNDRDSTRSNIYEFVYKTLKLLKQDTCEDCVSRKAVLDKIKEVCFSKEWMDFRISYGTNGQRDLIIKFIEDMPPVVPTPKWNTTPPTENTYDILLSTETEDGERNVWMGSYEHGHYYYADGYLEVDDEIVAWMPAPPPMERRGE